MMSKVPHYDTIGVLCFSVENESFINYIYG